MSQETPFDFHNIACLFPLKGCQLGDGDELLDVACGGAISDVGLLCPELEG